MACVHLRVRGYTMDVDVCRRNLVSLLLTASLSAAPALALLHAAAFAAPPSALEPPIQTPVVVCFGDSITAGYGLPPGEAYPEVLGRKLEAAGYRYRVVNRGTSGATTRDAVEAAPSIVRLHPAVAIVEFGGNDGLRGVPLVQMRRNLDEVLTTLEAAHIRVLLAGITLPPNYGPDFIRQFEAVFRQVAASHHAVLVPMIYSGLLHQQGVIQADGIHPTAKGSSIVADTLLSALKPMLKK